MPTVSELGLLGGVRGSLALQPTRPGTAGIITDRFFSPRMKQIQIQSRCERNLMKSATSRNLNLLKFQRETSKISKQSKRGGSRPGAGRKPGSRNKPTFPHEPIAAALAKAVEGKPAFLFVAAMKALEAPLDDVREALGMSREQFLKEYGQFIAALTDLQRRGSLAVAADK